MKLPPAYRRAVVSRPVFTALREWQLLEPSAVHRCADDSWEELKAIRGVVIAEDVGGNPLFFKFAGSSSRKLGDALWRWDHDGGEVSRVADDFEALLEGEGAMDGDDDADGEEGEEEDDVETDEFDPNDAVCRFCGSGLQGKSVCAVCTRGVDEPVETDENTEREGLARTLLAELVQQRQLELVTPSSRAAVEAATARAIGHEKSDRENATSLLEAWEEHAAIAEIFIDEELLEQTLHELRRTARHG